MLPPEHRRPAHERDGMSGRLSRHIHVLGDQPSGGDAGTHATRGGGDVPAPAMRAAESGCEADRCLVPQHGRCQPPTATGSALSSEGQHGRPYDPARMSACLPMEIVTIPAVGRQCELLCHPVGEFLGGHPTATLPLVNTIAGGRSPDRGRQASPLPKCSPRSPSRTAPRALHSHSGTAPGRHPGGPIPSAQSAREPWLPT